MLRSLLKSVLRPFRPGIEVARRGILGLPAVGAVDFGDLRRTAPISRKFGVDRGLPVDRFYIERFLAAEGDSIRGQVLEIGEDSYTRRFGGQRVTGKDVLHVNGDNPAATIVADLADAPQIPDQRFDSIVLTQTLQLIFDPPAALRTLHRILKPGGALLVTVPGISPVATRSVWGPTWYWSFTEVSLRRLLAATFGARDCRLETHGNVLAAVAFLEGLAAEDVTPDELSSPRPGLPGHHHRAGTQDCMITTRARGEAVRVAKWVLRPWRRRTRAHALILLFHRVAHARSDPWKLCVSPVNFRKQLEVLGRYCEFVPLTELPGRLEAARPALRTPVAITFDDGYVDNLRYALPALKEVGAPATVFLATDWIGRTGSFWWDRLSATVLESPRLPTAIDLEIGTAGFSWRAGQLHFTGDRQRTRLHQALWQFCQSLSDDGRDLALARLDEIFGVVSTGDPDARPMRPDEVRELHGSGLVCIGAHAQSHRPFPVLSEAEQSAEISGSRDACRALTGVAPECFAYPHGEVAPRSPQLVERAGFTLACSTVEELAWPDRDRYQLPRVSVRDTDAGRFENWLTSTWLL